MQPRLLLLLAFLVSASCAGTAKPGQPSWRRSQNTATESSQSVSDVRPTLLKLKSTSTTVTEYNASTPVPAMRSEMSEAILAVVNEASVASGVKAPVPDGRLFRALDELAEVTPVESPVDYSLIEFALQRNGIIEPSPHLIIIWGNLNDPDSVADQLRTRLTSILAKGRYHRVGVGLAQRGASGDLILLALQESHLTTNSIPRQLPAGGSLSIEGTLARDFSNPHVFHTSDQGNVQRLSVGQLGARGFRVRFDCKAQVGRQQVEITAEDRSGSTVLANFPVWCGLPAPTSMQVKALDDPTPTSREEAEERMLALLNKDRRLHGLPALALDTRLQAVARLHSDEMLRTGKVAHVSSSTGSASDRVSAGQIRTAIVLENVARAYGVAEAELGLMNSPGHRANILSKEVSHVGFGITLGEEVAGRRELLVTQLFIRIAGKIDSRQVRQQAISKIRSIRGAMRSELSLQRIAQVFAETIAKGASAKEASLIARESLDINSGNFRRVSTLITTVADIDSFDPTDSLGSPNVAFFGVGVGQGSHEVMGDGAIYLVILLAER